MTSINQLFADRRCSEAILSFLATTRIGREAGPPPGGETERGTGDSPGNSDSEREGEEAESELGGENEDSQGALAQAARAGEGHGGGDEGQAQAQAVIDLVLGWRARLTPSRRVRRQSYFSYFSFLFFLFPYLLSFLVFPCIFRQLRG